MKNLNEEMFGVVDKDNRFISLSGNPKIFWRAFYEKNDVFFFYSDLRAKEALKDIEKHFKLKELKVVKVDMSIQFNEIV